MIMVLTSPYFLIIEVIKSLVSHIRKNMIMVIKEIEREEEWLDVREKEGCE